MVQPGRHATMGKIRKYLVENRHIEKKDKMSIIEVNVVEKWNELVGEETEDEDSEETETVTL